MESPGRCIRFSVGRAAPDDSESGGACSIIVFNGVRFIDDLMANRLLDTLSMEARTLLLFA